MRPMTEQERQAFLAEPRVGVLSVASDDARPPLTVPLGTATIRAANLPSLPGRRGAGPARLS